jgi:hypothetical protein
VAISFLKDFLRRTYGIMLHKDKPLSSPALWFIAIIGARGQRDRGTSARGGTVRVGLRGSRVELGGRAVLGLSGEWHP